MCSEVKRAITCATYPLHGWNGASVIMKKTATFAGATAETWTT